MRKYIVGLVIVSLCLIASSCTDNDKELSSNISKWNSAVSAMNTVYTMVDQVDSLSNFSILDNRVQSGIKYFDQAIREIQETPYSKDAENMNVALIDYMKACKDILFVYKQLSDNAETLTEEDMVNYDDELVSLNTILEQKENVVSKAQMDYSDKFGLNLRVVGNVN